MFYVYAALGLLGALFYSRLPHAKAQKAAPQATRWARREPPHLKCERPFRQ
jgi:hypothetical protein